MAAYLSFFDVRTCSLWLHPCKSRIRIRCMGQILSSNSDGTSTGVGEAITVGQRSAGFGGQQANLLAFESHFEADGLVVRRPRRRTAGRKSLGLLILQMLRKLHRPHLSFERDLTF